MLYQNFFSPQVKGTVIIVNKHGIYELPYELPKDLRLKDLKDLKDLRKLGNIKKISKLHRILTKYPVFLPE